MTWLSAFQARVDRVLGGVLATGLGVAVLVVLWQVVSRYALGDPSPWTGELARYLMIWIGLLGAAQVTGQRLHLAIDLLPARLDGAARHRHGMVVHLFILIFAVAVLVVGGCHLVALVWQLGQRSAALGVPLAVVYLALPLAGLLIAFHAGVFALRDALALRAHAGETDPHDQGALG